MHLGLESPNSEKDDRNNCICIIMCSLPNDKYICFKQQTNSETIKLKADIERLEAMNTEMRKQLENQAPEKSDEQPQSNGQTSAANR